MSSIVFHEARATAFYLHTASGFLLNVLDIRTALAYNLSAQVEARNRLKVYGYLLFRPFALT